MDIPYLVRRAVFEHRDQPAVSCDGATRTYAHLDRNARRLANALTGLGLRAGDRVAVLLENRLEYPEIDVALAYAGLVRVAFNIRLAVEDFSYAIGDCGARALVSQASFDPIATELTTQHGLVWVRLDDEDDCPASAHPYHATLDAARESAPAPGRLEGELGWISYTSGTTGRPKGVMLTHSNLVQVAMNIMTELGVPTTADSVLLLQPLSHGAGYFLLPYLSSGGHVHIMRRFDADRVVEYGIRERISTLKLVPTMLRDLVESSRTAPFSTIIYGAAPIDRPTLERAMDRYGPVFSQLYGQSEAPMTITYLAKKDHQLGKPWLESAGRPWRAVPAEVAASDGSPVEPGEPGEVVVAGPHVMRGYYGMPERTAEVLRDGWLWTGDIAVRDEHGFIYLRGRRDQMINSGGFNIAPKEVEDVVAQYAGVREVVAVGVPHERWGQAVRVYVTPQDGAHLTEQALVEHCAPRLGFRQPRSVIVLDQLPRTAYGKVDRNGLEDARKRADR